MTEDLFFDTDCLSAFLWINNTNILETLYGGRIVFRRNKKFIAMKCAKPYNWGCCDSNAIQSCCVVGNVTGNDDFFYSTVGKRHVYAIMSWCKNTELDNEGEYIKNGKLQRQFRD